MFRQLSSRATGIGVVSVGYRGISAAATGSSLTMASASAQVERGTEQVVAVDEKLTSRWFSSASSRLPRTKAGSKSSSLSPLSTSSSSSNLSSSTSGSGNPGLVASGDSAAACRHMFHSSATAFDKFYEPSDDFSMRHFGTTDAELEEMATVCGYSSSEALVDAAIPTNIRVAAEEANADVPPPLSEAASLSALRELASKNKVCRSYIGQGFYGTLVPSAIQRNVLENPGWYTPYTPYQAEVAQGRLEALLTYQTMVSDLTGMPWANASLLDEASASAEALLLCHAASRRRRHTFFVADDVNEQSLSNIQTRAWPLGIEIIVGDPHSADFEAMQPSGILLQYPGTFGAVADPRPVIERAHAAGALVCMATDLLALTQLTPPGELGADVALGNSQRFGVPLGGGGPHAAFFAVGDAQLRLMAGRLVGVSRDAQGNLAYRMALQTREQHIRRERATSNVCTAQALLANTAAFYAVYHGAEGLTRIAQRVHGLTRALAQVLTAGPALSLQLGAPAGPTPELFFDTLTVDVGDSQPGAADRVVQCALVEHDINLRRVSERHVGVSLDETVTRDDLVDIVRSFYTALAPQHTDDALAHVEQALAEPLLPEYGTTLTRTSTFLTAPTFTSYRSETELMRYLARLHKRDIGLDTSMVPLGSCTMKLNSASSMMPISWPEFNSIHPFAPLDQQLGYHELTDRLRHWLSSVTGFADVSLQPNSGATGEYAGLLAIKRFHTARGEGHRNIVIVPASAHGTNPASAIIAGMKTATIQADAKGNTDMDDLRATIAKHRDDLAALMITYPSTFGVFEPNIVEICELIHEAGGQVYMDGANLNAQMGFTSPGFIGADVCHLNLHKTFSIPHGGGGPGMGPIGVAAHLVEHLPDNPLPNDAPSAVGATRAASPEGVPSRLPVTGAQWGSVSILPISYQFIAMLGRDGLRGSAKRAIIHANYMAARLAPHYKILFTNENDRCAHEFIIDIRPITKRCGVVVEDIAKRLQDFGFHAPTMSWPTANTLMIEPTESESREELDRYVDALIAIKGEIDEIERKHAETADETVLSDNLLKNAPHTMHVVTAEHWPHEHYSRDQAAFPAEHLRDHKHWPAVGRIDNVAGDRALVVNLNQLPESFELRTLNKMPLSVKKKQ